MAGFSFAVVVVRLYARKCLVRELGWDDLFIVLAQVSLAQSLLDMVRLIRSADELGDDGPLHDDPPQRGRPTPASYS